MRDSREIDALERLHEILRKASVPGIEAGSTHVRFSPLEKDGFHVGLYVVDGLYTVYYEGWHEEVDGSENAIRAFLFGLTDRARLRVLERGGFPYRWMFEILDGSAWTPISETGLLFFKFWSSKRELLLQNRVLSPDMFGASIAPEPTARHIAARPHAGACRSASTY